MAELHELVRVIGPPLRALAVMLAAVAALVLVHPRLPRTGRSLVLAALLSAAPYAVWPALEAAELDLGELTQLSLGTLYQMLVLVALVLHLRALARDARTAHDADLSARRPTQTFE